MELAEKELLYRWSLLVSRMFRQLTLRINLRDRLICLKNLRTIIKMNFSLP